MSKTYVFHTDPGHGWLAVPRAELIALGVLAKVSHCSYENGGTIYLEEDCDAPLFLAAYEAKFGQRPNVRESNRERTPIRYYARFVPAA